MHISPSLLAFTLPLLGLTSAAPTSTAQSAPQPTTQYWTFESFTRTSNAKLTLSTISFTILYPAGSNHTQTQFCKYQVSGSPSTQASYENVLCGNFLIGSGWSGYFGPGNGFTTLSVKRGNSIAWPAYEDSVLKNGTAVKPDRSYPVKQFSSVVMVDED